MGFAKWFLVRKSAEKCVGERVPDQTRDFEMGTSVGFLSTKRFPVWVLDGIPDNIPEPRAFPVTTVCPCRSLLTSG